MMFNVHLASEPYQPYQLLRIPYPDGKKAPFLETAAEAVVAAQQARGHQVKLLLEEVENVCNQKMPMFITGDMNEPSHLDWTAEAAKIGRHPHVVKYPTTSAIVDAGFVDAFREIHPNEIRKPGFTWTPRTKPDNPRDHQDRIDFVFVRGQGVKVVDTKIVGENATNANIVVSPYPSDHRAVVAEIVLGSEGQ